MTLAEINHIFLEAGNCQRCYPGQEIYVPLPDQNNSRGTAEVMFLLERPGRIGTGESGYVSFDNEDDTARFAKECFEGTRLNKKSVFVTNACLCHPALEGYTDTKPTIRELTNCHHWLRQQLKIVRPLLIVTIGERAFTSLCRYFALSLPKGKQALKHWAGQLIDMTDPWIYPVYHTSKLGRGNRNDASQKADWLKIPEIVDHARKKATKAAQNPSKKIGDTVG